MGPQGQVDGRAEDRAQQCPSSGAATGTALGQDSSPEEDSGGQEDGRTEDVGVAVVAGCNAPPVFPVGKKDSRFYDPCDTLSCCNVLVSCGSDGAGCKA